MAERDVIYRIAMEYDAQKSKAAAAAMVADSKQVADAQMSATQQVAKSRREAAERDAASSSTRAAAAAKQDGDAMERAKRAAQEQLKSMADKTAAWKAEAAAREKAFNEERTQHALRMQFSREAAAEDARRFQQSKLSMSQLATQNATSSAQMIDSGNKIRQGIVRTIGAVERLTRGVALLGLASDKDLGKFVDRIAPVIGALDLVAGGIQLYQGVGNSLNFSGITRGAGSAIGNAGGVLPGTSSPLRTIASSPVAQSAAIGGTRMLFGAGAAGASGEAAAGAGTAGTAAAGVGASTVAAGALAVVGTILGGISIVETIRDIRAYGFGKGGRPGGWNDTVGGALQAPDLAIQRGIRTVQRWGGSEKPTGWLGNENTNAFLDSEDAMARMRKQRERDQQARENAARSAAYEDQQRAEAEQLASFDIDIRRRGLDARLKSYGAGAEGSYDARFAVGRGADSYALRNNRRLQLDAEQAGMRGEIRDLGIGIATEADEHKRKALEEDRARIQIALNESKREGLMITKQETEETLRNSQAMLSSLRQQKDAAQDIIRTNQEKMMSLKERFGEMNSFDQSRFIRLARQAKEAHEAEAAGKIGEAERIRGRWTGSDREMLRRGDDLMGGEATKAAYLGADKGGFAKAETGSIERKRIFDAADAEREINRNIEVQRKYEVTVQNDFTKLAEALLPALRKGDEENAKIISKMVNDRVEEAKQVLMREINRRTMESANSASNIRRGG